MKTTDSLLVFDIDNTLLRNWKGWDAIFRATSLSLYGKEFSMLTHPDGTEDKTFSRKTTSELWRQRITQIGLDPDQADEKAFYDAFDDAAAKINYGSLAEVFPGLRNLLALVPNVSTRRPLLLTTGPRKMQTKVLSDLRLINSFDTDSSYFYGECPTKAEGLREIATAHRPELLVYFGDAPGDMKALHCPKIEVPKRLAVGVICSQLVSPIDLLQAGAHGIVDKFDGETIKGVQSLITEA